MPRLSTKTAVVWAALIVLPAFGLLLWVDKAVPQAGFWALLALSISVGFVHGALDAVLLPQRFASRVQAALMFVAYLLIVAVLGWVLGSTTSLALWALLLMSAWHFGEPYGRWDRLPAWQTGLTRAVVGGAPVMLPVWLAGEQLTTVLVGVVPAGGLRGWDALAWGWLVLLVIWLLAFWLQAGGLARIRVLRYAWFELLGGVFLYALFSPLMAFALYFGLYHAPVHIWRVWRCWRGSSRAALNGSTDGSTVWAMVAVVLTTMLSWLLGAGLWWFLASSGAAGPDWASALRWLIVAFAALTAPHLVLISLCAAFLTQPHLNR